MFLALLWIIFKKDFMCVCLPAGGTTYMQCPEKSVPDHLELEL